VTEIETTLYLHIGLPKTGTTAIQRYMYFNRDAYAAQGVFWAETHPNELHEINDWAHHVYSHKWGGWLDPAKFAVTPDTAWERLGETMRATPGRYFVSSERFADLLPLPVGRAMLEYVQRIVSPARLVVVGYVRRQDLAIESHLKELIKGGNLKTSLEEYLADPASFLSFGRGFTAAAGVVGRANVIARIYERERLAGRDAVTDFLTICGLPTLPSTAHAALDEANPSLGTLSGKVALDPRMAEILRGKPGRWRYINELLNRGRFERMDRFSILELETRNRVMERYAEENRAFAKLFLTEDDARALRYDPDECRPYLADDMPIFTYDDMIEILASVYPPPR